MKTEILPCKIHNILPNWVEKVDSFMHGHQILQQAMQFPHGEYILRCRLCELEKLDERTRPEIESWNERQK